MATTPQPDDDLLPEYDLSQLRGGVRGKHYAKYQAQLPHVVRLDPDVAAVLPTEEAVLRDCSRVPDLRVENWLD